MRLPTVCFRHVGSDAVADLCIRRPFFPSSTFFSGYFCTFLCSLPVLHCARSRSGGVRCVAFYKHDLAFVPFSFFHPLHVGEQSVEYPQGVISIQRTKASGLARATCFSFYHNTILCCAFSLSLWYFGCLYLAHSDHPPKLTFSKCIAPYRCDNVKVPFCTSYRVRALFT